MESLDLFEQSETISYERILAELLKEENIDLKTEIFNPHKLSVLKLFRGYFAKLKMNQLVTLIDSFIETYLRYMVSYNRKSREEIIQAFINIARDRLGKKGENATLG